MCDATAFLCNAEKVLQTLINMLYYKHERGSRVKNDNINDLVIKYIKDNYSVKTPIFIKEIYEAFPTFNHGTIRSIFKRLYDNNTIEKIDNGVYALPNKESILGRSTVFISEVIKKKYLRDDQSIIGYVTGINFANMLGLTSQTASVETIFSNAVSKKKREIKLKNNRLIINASRVPITNNNYKLLQILDLLNDFEKYSEYDLRTANKKIIQYISSVQLSEIELDEIVSNFPLEAQVKFYKIGGAYAITPNPKGI